MFHNCIKYYFYVFNYPSLTQTFYVTSTMPCNVYDLHETVKRYGHINKIKRDKMLIYNPLVCFLFHDTSVQYDGMERQWCHRPY